MIELQRGGTLKTSAECRSRTAKWIIGGEEGYVSAAYDEAGNPVRVTIMVDRVGDKPRGLLATICVLTNLALERGVPFETLRDACIGLTFEPAGPTNCPAVPLVRSVVDFAFRWVELGRAQ